MWCDAVPSMYVWFVMWCGAQHARVMLVMRCTHATAVRSALWCDYNDAHSSGAQYFINYLRHMYVMRCSNKPLCEHASGTKFCDTWSRRQWWLDRDVNGDLITDSVKTPFNSKHGCIVIKHVWPPPNMSDRHQTCLTAIKDIWPPSNMFDRHQTCLTVIKHVWPSSNMSGVRHQTWLTVIIFDANRMNVSAICVEYGARGMRKRAKWFLDAMTCGKLLYSDWTE